jgi:hypothetical protein
VSDDNKLPWPEYSPSSWFGQVLKRYRRTGGACKSVKTTPLLTIAEGIEAMKKAAECGYRPATATG